MAEPIRMLVSAFSRVWRLAPNGLRMYRRLRWRRRPGWFAGAVRKPMEAIPDIVAWGNHALTPSHWEVQYPGGTMRIALPLVPVTQVVLAFPESELEKVRGRVPHGRYWFILYAWVDPFRREPICKVPARVHDDRSRFWRWYEQKVFLRIWERRFGGVPPNHPAGS